jgi:hypothetical protein
MWVNTYTTMNPILECHAGKYDPEIFSMKFSPQVSSRITISYTQFKPIYKLLKLHLLTTVNNEHVVQHTAALTVHWKNPKTENIPMLS